MWGGGGGSWLDFRKVLRTISSGSGASDALFVPSALSWALALRNSLAPSARFISGLFALFYFLLCLHIVPLPKMLASRLVASLGTGLKTPFSQYFQKCACVCVFVRVCFRLFLVKVNFIKA